MASKVPFSDRTLTPAQIFCVIFAIPLFLSALFVAITLIFPSDWRPPEEDQAKLTILLYVFGGSLILFCSALTWQFMAFGGNDREPDILAELFGDNVLQVGSAHFTCLPVQRGTMLRIFLFIQNTRNVPGRVELQLGSANFAKFVISPLHCEIGPAAVELAAIDIPIWTPPSPIVVPMEVNGSFWLYGSGKQVRFRQCAQIGNATRRTLLTVAMAFGGHLSLGGDEAAKILVPLVPVVELPTKVGASLPLISNTESPTPWRTVTVWSPELRNSAEQVGQIISQSMSPLPI